MELKQHLTETTFESLDLAEPLLRGIAATGFHVCTPIQAQTLPLALAGHDVMGQAQTGTGKTAAFLVATYDYLLKNPDDNRKPNQPAAIIIAPTRELAIQIHKDAETLGQYTGLNLALVYGGEGYGSQRKPFETGVDIIVGTPGRIIDYYKQRVFDLRAIKVVVVDEADRMFDMGFVKDIRYLLRRMPKPDKRLNLLFSATLSLRVQELSYEHMNNPKAVEVEPEQVTAENVKELIYFPAKEEKIPLLLGILQHLPISRILIFVNTKHAADKVNDYLHANEYKAGVLSGDVPQRKRQQLLSRFQDGQLRILVATDVAARGLHIPEVSHVLNFDLPQDAEDYVHRIGRTARAGAAGEAISFACEEYAFSLGDIESFIGHKIPVENVTDDVLATPKRPAQKSKRPRKPSHKRGAKSSTNEHKPQQKRRRRRGKSGTGASTGAPSQ